MAIQARLEAATLRPDQELSGFVAELHGDGAVVSFVGLARPGDQAGQRVTALRLEHYPGMTEASLEAIARDAAERFDVSAVRVVHRCGRIEPGEAIVFAAAASRHRRAAFEAADYLMDRLKTEAVFWKREEGVDNAKWVEPGEADHQDRARWSDPCPE